MNPFPIILFHFLNPNKDNEKILQAANFQFLCYLFKLYGYLSILELFHDEMCWTRLVSNVLVFADVDPRTTSNAADMKQIMQILK